MKTSVHAFDKQSRLTLMLRTSRQLGLVAVALATVLHFGAMPVRAAGNVAGCTDDAFRAALVGGGTINFTSACSITLTGAVTIASNTTILTGGNVVTLSGGNSNRIFTVSSGVVFNINGLTLSNGRSTNGGAIHVGTNATVQLTNCVLTANNAFGLNGIFGNNGNTNGSGHGSNGGGGTAGTAGNGGAIYNLGSVLLINCTLSTNFAIGGSGGDGGNGGAGEFRGGNGGSGAGGGTAFGGVIFNQGTLSARDCTFTRNSASGGFGGFGGFGGSAPDPGLNGNGAAGATGSGGVIYNAQTATLVNCTFSDNTAWGGNSADGGRLGNGNGYDASPGADSFGGGLFNSGTALATNCTFYNNRVTGGDAGNGGDGEFTGGDGGAGGHGTGGSFYSTASVTLVHNTFSHGSAFGGTNGVAGTGVFPDAVNGSPGQSRGGNIARGAGTFTIKNTILATNLSGGCGYGIIVDGGNNICADGSLALGGSSFTNTDPKLGSFGDNGGATKTLYPLVGSPAIDAATDIAALNYDQRGFTRPSGRHADIGSVETLLPTLTSLSSSSTNFSFSYPTVVGLTYVIQLKTNLTDLVWTSISTNVGTGSLVNYSATKLNTGSRFFRLSVQ